MGEIKDMLLKAYLKKGPKPQKPRETAKAAGEPPKPAPVEKPRTLGNITTAMLAQRIYNPQLPPAPKSPSKAMVNQGTADAMSLNGPWGRPEDK